MKYTVPNQVYRLITGVRLLLIIVSLTTADATLAFRPSAHAGVAPVAATRDISGQTINTTEDVIVKVEIAAEDISSVVVFGKNQRAVRVEGAPGGVQLSRRDAAEGRDTSAGVGVVIGESTEPLVRRVNPAADKRAIEISVPLGASVRLSARDSNITIKDVAEANAQSVQGDITIERVSRSIEASNVTGRTSVKECRGRSRLRSVSGEVEVTGAQATAPSDSLRIATVSGDIKLERVTNEQIELDSVSGAITFDGALSPNMRLGAKTTSGDISLSLPAEASFRVVASVSSGGFNSDFPLKLTDNSMRRTSLRFTGERGSGGATLDLASHSGSIRIRRQK
jgi:hypothetical protein